MVEGVWVRCPHDCLPLSGPIPLCVYRARSYMGHVCAGWYVSSCGCVLWRGSKVTCTFRWGSGTSFGVAPPGEVSPTNQLVSCRASVVLRVVSPDSPSGARDGAIAATVRDGPATVGDQPRVQLYSLTRDVSLLRQKVPWAARRVVLGSRNSTR